MPSHHARVRALMLFASAVLPLLCFVLVACGGGSKNGSRAAAPVSPNVSINPLQASATLTSGVAAASGATTAAQGAAPAQTPAAAPPAATATASAVARPLVTLTPPPPPDPAPCKEGQIKGDNSTHNYYLPGMTGYSSLHNNVQCFNTMDQAQGAGFHLPGQGG